MRFRFFSTVWCACGCARNQVVYPLLIILVLLIITTALTLPFLMAGNLRHTPKNEVELQFLSWAKAAFSDKLYHARPAIHGVAGNVYGEPLVIPPFNGSVEERIKGQYFPTFDTAAGYFRQRFVRNDVLFVAPGGVVTQTSPPKTHWYLADLMRDSFGFRFPAFFNSSYPNFKTRVFRATGSKVWEILEVFALYNYSTTSPFWGITGVAMKFDDVLKGILFKETASERGIRFLISTQSPTNNSVIPISSSEGFNDTTPQDDLLQFIINSQTAELYQGGDIVFDLFVIQEEQSFLKLTQGWMLCLVLLLVTAGFSAALGVVLNSSGDYQSYQLAPKSPPFAMLIIGQQSEDVWSFATEELTAVLEKDMRKHKAYQIPQLLPNTSTFILKSVDDAVQMGLNVLRHVQVKLTDTDLSITTGDESPFVIMCAVHWCAEAEAILHPTDEFVQYHGPDITYCTKLFKSALGNAVVLSGAAKEQVSCISPNEINLFIPSPFQVRKDVPELFFLFGREDLMRNAFLRAQMHRPARRPSGVSESAVSERSEILGGGHPHPRGTERPEDTCSRSGNDLVERNHYSAAWGMGSYTRKTESSQRYFTFEQQKRELGTQKTQIRIAEEPSLGGDPLASFVSVVAGFQSPNMSVPVLEQERPVTPMTIDPSTIPPWLDRALQKTYERHALSFGASRWPSLSFVIYNFYFGYALLFQPLALRERENITQCLATAFGVPRQGLYEYLAVHCAMDFIHSKIKHLHPHFQS